jgi:ABC-type branched-subunit amino acid transport system ATPase component
MQLIQKLAYEEQLAVLLTEHAMDVVFGFADRLMVDASGALDRAGKC